MTWSLTPSRRTTTPLATGAAVYTIGGDANGPVAYVGGDGSVHVIGLDGTKMLDVAATATTAGDVLGTPMLSRDNAHVYYWQNGERQENRGTLMHVAVTAGATPSKIGDNISMLDLHIIDNSLVFVQNVRRPRAVRRCGQVGSRRLALRRLASRPRRRRPRPSIPGRIPGSRCS